MNNMKVAIKTLKEGMNQNDFKAEAALMKNLSHPKLIQLYALCTTEEPKHIKPTLLLTYSIFKVSFVLQASYINLKGIFLLGPFKSDLNDDIP